MEKKIFIRKKLFILFKLGNEVKNVVNKKIVNDKFFEKAKVIRNNEPNDLVKKAA